jgi:N-acetylglucosamine kinase-like BadF-type ATPase
VIGIDGGSSKCLLKAKDLHGKTVGEMVGQTTNHLMVGTPQAASRVAELIDSLLREFRAKKADCRCVVVGAAGIDSPRDRATVAGIYGALGFQCPIFCMNDGSVALYAATRGIGLVAISGTGSIVVGRNARGKTTRSGGYSSAIMGNEGSSRWIAIMALRHMSQWVDESVPTTPLVQKMIDHFGGFDADKMIECSTELTHRPVDPQLALLVHQAAREGDQAAVAILQRGADELFQVAQTVVQKLELDREQKFLSGVWGSVFVNNDVFLEEYRRLFTRTYPNAEVVFPDGDAADGAAAMASDYLRDRIPFIVELM